MKRLRLIIEALEPLLLTSIDGDPNSAVSHDYIPGSVLRGVAIGQYLKRKKQTSLSLADDEVRRLFFSNDVLFLNGYVRINNQRSLPSPRFLQVDKYENAQAVYRRIEEPDGKDTTTTIKKPKFLGGYVVVLGKGELGHAHVDKSIAVHIQRQRTKSEEERAIYQYEAIAQHQTFEAWIDCQGDKDAEVLAQWLDGKHYVGGGRSAGYGRVSITIQEETLERTTVASKEDGTYIVTLTSDAILRDDMGNYAPSINALRDVGFKGITGEASIRTTIVGGFNRKWGLPLPQTPAILMGSWFAVSASEITAEEIEALQAVGIGERCNEGFGQFVVDYFQQKEYSRQTSSAKSTVPQDSPEKVLRTLNLGEGFEWIERRLKAQSIEREIVEQARQLTIAHPPHSSQIGKLLSWISAELAKPTPDWVGLKKNLGAMKSTASKQFETAHIEGKTLLIWIESKIDEKKRENLLLMQHVLLRANKTRQQEGKHG
jgi:CRISPR-associated protein Csx10